MIERGKTTTVRMRPFSEYQKGHEWTRMFGAAVGAEPPPRREVTSASVFLPAEQPRPGYWKCHPAFVWKLTPQTCNAMGVKYPSWVCEHMLVLD